MMNLERPLKLPAPVVTLLWLAAAVPLPFPRQFRGEFWSVSVVPVYAPAIWFGLVLVLWTYALYDASIRHVSSASHHFERRLSFFIAAAFVALLTLSHVASGWSGTPPAWLFMAFGILLAVTCLWIVTVTFKASSALSRFEASVLSPDDKQRGSPLLAILFIGIGIWFLEDRIDRMLDHPTLAETPP